ncbi:pentapeptide repeat-containing protein [Aquimarina litoralis]|uniref:pentapeptide repeat-containing protein n=1 Tax=Aquimarina litoralis TaxID=584605 RepID=UPI001C590E91|nr:pentapeptide repeat-containing protein [Aquimarina litoralis]MBW1298118.1 hypothetical protein [Aquimarina litoralis]
MNYVDLFLNSINRRNFDEWNNITKIDIELNFYGNKIPLDKVNAIISSIRLNQLKIVNAAFENVDTSKVDFYATKFINCIFKDCWFEETSFESTTFENCKLIGGGFSELDFKSVDRNNILTFKTCNFNKSTFCKSTKIESVDFEGSSFVKTTFSACNLSNSKFYGTNVWDITIDNTTKQNNLIIHDTRGLLTNRIIVCDIEVAHIINLLCSNDKFSNLTSESQSKFILILGRFGVNKENLEKLKDKIIQDTNYSPIVFDWNNDKSNLDFIETIVFLSGFAKFIVADISNPKSVPAELQAILSNIMLPVFPIMHESDSEYAVFTSIKKYQWVYNLIVYDNFEKIIDKFEKAILYPAEKMCKDITEAKRTFDSKKIDDII